MTGKSSVGTMGMKKENLVWTTHMDDMFVEAMLRQDREGHRKNGIFTTKAYSNMVEELRQKLPLVDIKKDHLKNRLKSLKDNFSKCHGVFKNRTSAFGWCPVTKMWNATPELWEKLIAVKPEAAVWRSKTINNFDQLEELFGKGKLIGEGDRATGEFAGTAKEKKRRWAKDSSMCEDNLETADVIDNLFSQNEIMLGTYPGALDDGVDVVSKKLFTQAPSLSATKNAKMKKKKVENDVHEVSKLKSAIDNVAEAIREGNTILERSRPRVYSGTEICSLLEEIGINPELFDDAYLFLSKNPDVARAVFGYPFERRLSFLEKLMYPPSHAPC